MDVQFFHLYTRGKDWSQKVSILNKIYYSLVKIATDQKLHCLPCEYIPY